MIRLRRRWVAVIVGDESGCYIPLWFLTWRDRRKALAWAGAVNVAQRAVGDRLTHWEIHDCARYGGPL